MRVCIVGLGLIGGSLAHALLRSGIAPRATDSDRDTVAAARRDGILAERADQDGLRHALTDADVVVLAVPVGRIARSVVEVMAIAEAETPIMHAGSLQRADVLFLPPEASDRVVGTHPLAGTHESGYASSRASLFDGALVSIESRAGAAVRTAAESVWTAAGAKSFAYRTAEEHDSLMAWASHLPQLVSTALAATLDRAQIDPRDIGPGARDTTRLAASPLSLWADILGASPTDTIRALHELQSTLSELRSSLEESDDENLTAIWERGRRWKAAGGDR